LNESNGKLFQFVDSMLFDRVRWTVFQVPWEYFSGKDGSAPHRKICPICLWRHCLFWAV